MITVSGTGIDIDIRAELEGFPWMRPRWESDKLYAVSPFRYERTPSFFVRLEPDGNGPAGVWHDSGAIDPDWRSGGIVKLLAYLRQETIPETLEYLRDKYADPFSGAGGLNDEPQINPLNLTLPERYRPLDISMLDAYRFRSPYLGERGISESVQRLCRIGYDRRRQAVTIPWFNADGSLGNVKYRRVDAKTFWYATGGRRLSEMVYGINIVYQRKVKRAVIVEAEVDALTVMSAGICGIAIGGTAFTDTKRDLIVRSPLEEIIVLRDNDAPGRLLQRKIIAGLLPYMSVKIAIVPVKYGKDANEMAVNCGDLSAVKARIEQAKEVRRMKTLSLTGQLVN